MTRRLLIICVILSGILSYPYLAFGTTIDDSRGDGISMEYQGIVHKIFKDDELFILFYMDAALIVDPTQDNQIVKLVDSENPWNDIKDFLYGKSNIYFCPSDLQIGKAIEYMICPIDTTMLMSDRYGMYRLSSPDELFKNRGDSFRLSNHKAIVFGGIQYDDAVGYEDNLLAFRGQDTTREQGIKYTPLRSSYYEALYVDSVMRKNGMEVALLTGEYGTEASFYQIPDKSVDILHIASHAYYTPEIDNNSSGSLQEWMLSHTGLVLAGANNGCKFTKDDGHLTAYEISLTDLSSIKLAILSGCETGQGDIQENDVYGLLKGMKMAGAGSIMVSLSKVYDSATSILMNRFYDNIFRGDNPRRALENAQRFLRLYDKGQYNDTRFWARFILVDDLDRNVGSSLTEKEKEVFLHDIIGMEDIYSINNIFPKLKEARKKLNRNDIYVRLYSYSYYNHQQYVAMLVDPQKSHCSIVRLFQPNALENDTSQNPLLERPLSDANTILDYVPIETLDSIMWQPLKQQIEGKTTIYVQAMGLFDNYPIELMPSLSDRHVYRVSSIESFSRNEPMPSVEKQIWLYGGLEYDLSTDDLLKDSQKYGLTRGPRSRLFPYLPGTLDEVESIAKSCMHAHWPYMVLTKETGTEMSFRSIENNPVGTIHIATHGFSISDNSISHRIQKKSNCDMRSLKEYLLSNCGLLFSGANNAFVGDIHIQSKNDGVIWGSDIFKMDFSNVDLVVLSTCNSSGKRHYDRTWNLIQAFKLAGVKSIIYSLWKVDDEATSALMAEFYKNWISGMTKNRALEEAKRFIRSFEKWKEPRYWASFVLIDSTE